VGDRLGSTELKIGIEIAVIGCDQAKLDAFLPELGTEDIGYGIKRRFTKGRVA